MIVPSKCLRLILNTWIWKYCPNEIKSTPHPKSTKKRVVWIKCTQRQIVHCSYRTWRVYYQRTLSIHSNGDGEGTYRASKHEHHHCSELSTKSISNISLRVICSLVLVFAVSQPLGQLPFATGSPVEETHSFAYINIRKHISNNLFHTSTFRSIWNQMRVEGKMQNGIVWNPVVCLDKC